MSGSGFTWDKESTVVDSVRAIAVYTNTAGDIVIRQESTGHGDHGDDDDVIVIPRRLVGTVVKALKAEAAKDFEPGEQ